MSKTAPEMKWLIAAGVIGVAAIASGAFTAHGLEHRVSERAMSALHTGSNYAMVHAIVLLGITALIDKSPRFLNLAAWAFVLGVILFSGSLIIFGVTEFRNHLWITPIGGLSLMVGWGFVAWAGIRTAK